MTGRSLFTALPEDLFAEATEIAQMQGVTLSDLLVEALAESVEKYQRRGWVAERALPCAERGPRVSSGRMQH